MQRLIASGVLVMVVYAVTLIVGTAIAAPNAFTGLAQYFSPQYYGELYGGITGNWQEMGQLFTQLQSDSVLESISWGYYRYSDDIFASFYYYRG